MIPIFAFHHDERHFSNAERFNSERDCRNLEAFMPFRVGPRTCLGSRFALLTVKVILVALLRKYEFHVAEIQEGRRHRNA
jgi:cytochrome P450